MVCEWCEYSIFILAYNDVHPIQVPNPLEVKGYRTWGTIYRDMWGR